MQVQIYCKHSSWIYLIITYCARQLLCEKKPKTTTPPPHTKPQNPQKKNQNKAKQKKTQNPKTKPRKLPTNQRKIQNKATDHNMFQTLWKQFNEALKDELSTLSA